MQCIARDLPEPSPLAHEILNAKPYAFLDNAPLEERRTQAVYLRRATTEADRELGILDPRPYRKSLRRSLATCRPTPTSFTRLCCSWA